MTDDTGNTNQRVTNALLMAELKNMGKDIDEIKGGMKPNTEHRIACEERWKAHDREHTSLNTKKWAGDIGAAIAGAVAGAAAAMTKS